jgi:hypothetical protein
MRTGQLIGLYEALISYMGLRHQINLQGDFYNDKINIKLDWKLRGRFAVFLIVWAVLRFAVQKPVLDAVRWYSGR